MWLSQVTLDLSGAAANKLPGAVAESTPVAGLGELIGNLLGIIFIVAVLIVFVYLIWAGIDWITAGDDSGKTAKARTKITNAIIGLIVLSASVSIILVLQSFLNIRVFSIEGGLVPFGEKAAEQSQNLR